MQISLRAVHGWLRDRRGCGVDGEQILKERLEQLEIKGVGAVGFGAGGIIVDFEEEAIDAGGDGGASEERNEFRLATADAVGSRGLLDGMGGVEDDWRKAVHDSEGAEIDDEIVVAEAGTAFGEEDARIACGADLVDAVAHVPGRDELAFFDVDGAAGAAGGDEEVGLAAEKCGNLENVDGFGGNFAVGGLVNIREYGKTGVAGDAAEDLDTCFEAGAAKTFDAGAVCLVVAGFEDAGDGEIGGDALK